MHLSFLHSSPPLFLYPSSSPSSLIHVCLKIYFACVCAQVHSPQVLTAAFVIEVDNHRNLLMPIFLSVFTCTSATADGWHCNSLQYDNATASCKAIQNTPGITDKLSSCHACLQRKERQFNQPLQS